MAAVLSETELASLGKQSGTEAPREEGRGTGRQRGGHGWRQGRGMQQGALHPQVSPYISPGGGHSSGVLLG